MYRNRITSLIISVLAVTAMLLPGTALAGVRTVHVSNGEDFAMALWGNPYVATVIELDSDIDVITSATVDSVGQLTIEGNGHTLNGNGTINTALRFSNRVAPTEPVHNKITLRNLTLKDLNSTIRYGGGAIAMRNGSLEVENCAFIGNRWTSSAANNERGGGAICMENAASIMNITNSTFYGNKTELTAATNLVSGSGGAIYTAGGGSITNCTIVGNSASNTNTGIVS
ncbi:MAG: hypothetical protein LBK91_02725, partial [Synergistaceae bacterium]|nr:hypothetical protein [Synergistaceae bacterium]